MSLTDKIGEYTLDENTWWNKLVGTNRRNKSLKRSCSGLKRRLLGKRLLSKVGKSLEDE